MSASTPQQRLAHLRALEQRHGLFDHRVDGWSAWRVLRHPLHQIVAGLPMSAPVLPQGRRVRDALRATLRLAGIWLRGRSRRLIVKTYRSALRVPLGDRVRDTYFDGLLQRQPEAYKLEVVNSGAYEAQAAAAWRPADLDAVVFTFWGRVLGRLRPPADGGFAERAAALMASEAGLTLPPAWYRDRVATVYWQSRLYGALLDRVRPRTVLVADAGDFGLAIACRRRGIRFIELQHGVFDHQHPDAVPLWAKGSATELVLPDFLACHGTHWIERLAGTHQGQGQGEGIARAVGNEMIDLARPARRADRTPGAHLVMTSQGLDSERAAAWLQAMMDAAPAHLDWRLSIKLHPSYDEGGRDYAALASHPRVRIIEGSTAPNVYTLLADADLHLSIASACHYDAAAMGVPSVVMPLAAHEQMLPAIDGEAITLAAGPEDVWTRAIGRCLPVALSERFAQPGCVAALEELLA